MEELAKEAAFATMMDVLSTLFENDIIKSNTYSALSNKELYMKALEAKYHYIKVVNEGLNKDDYTNYDE